METVTVIIETMSISPLLREMKRDYGSMRKLAKALGMTPGGLSKLVNEKHPPSGPTCLAIARVSGKPLEQVMELAYNGKGSRPNGTVPQ